MVGEEIGYFLSNSWRENAVKKLSPDLTIAKNSKKNNITI